MMTHRHEVPAGYGFGGGHPASRPAVRGEGVQHDIVLPRDAGDRLTHPRFDRGALERVTAALDAQGSVVDFAEERP
jgi:hypothetical protein